MNTPDFLTNFANQFDDTDIDDLSLETKFKELPEWGSLVALATINMIARKYNVTVTTEDIRSANTIRDLRDIVQSKP